MEIVNKYLTGWEMLESIYFLVGIQGKIALYNYLSVIV